MEQDGDIDTELTSSLFAMALYKLVKKHTKQRKGWRSKSNKKIKFKNFIIKVAKKRRELMLMPNDGDFHISMYIDDDTGKNMIHMKLNERHEEPILIGGQLMDELWNTMSDSVKGASKGSDIDDLETDGCVITVYDPTVIEEDVRKIDKGFGLEIEANGESVTRDELAEHDEKFGTVRGSDGRIRHFFIVKDGKIHLWGGDTIGKISKKVADAFRLSRDCHDHPDV